LQYTDLSILGRADFGLNFTRTYNSKDYEKSAFGYGWTFTGDEKIFINTGGDNSKLQYKDADGTIHVFSYNATTGMYYPPAGNFDKLAKIDGSTYVLTDPYGYKTTFKVRESTNDTDVEVAYISSQEDRNGNGIRYVYDTKNQLVSIYTDLGNELGEKINFTYNSSGLIEKANYNNQEIIYGYKTGGYLESVKVKKSSDVEEITQFEYTNNRISAVIDPEGKRTSLAFTSEDDLTSVIQPSDDGTAPPTKYTLDRVNGLATITSPEGDVTRYYFDDNYVINRVILPSGEEILYEFDSNYRITKETTIIDGQTSVIANTYDVNGNLLETTDAELNKESYTYTTYQNIATYTDSTGAVSTYQYDVNGNLKTSIVPSANDSILTTTYDYDTHGELTKLVTSNGVEESYTTDYTGSPATKTTTYKDAFNNITKTVTDLNGNVRQSIDGKSQLTAFDYNLKNELTNVTDAKNQTTKYDYDNNGNLETVTNPLGKVTSYLYNAQNQISSETNPLGDITTYAYNADGELEEIKKADSQTIQYLTDDINNFSTVSVNGVEKFKTRTEGTDTIVENRASQTSVRYKYYDNGLPQTVLFNEQSANAIHYTYYGNESVESIQYSNNTIKRHVDSAQNTRALLINDVTQADFVYNAKGLLNNIVFKNGVASIEKDYDSGLRLEQEIMSTNSIPWKTFTYGYDASQNITSINGTDGSLITYKYDALDQLESEVYSDGTSIQYTYDAAGNRTTKTTTKNGSTTTVDYVYNDANHLKNVNGQEYEIDKNGNLINDGKFQYEWNAFDQLTKVTTIEGAVVAEYRYDDQGRRVYSKEDNGETYYRYNGTSNHVLFEEDVNGAITKAYTYDDLGYPLTMKYDGQTYYYLTNYRGDVLALVSESGERVATYTYDAWGNILSQSGSMASINPYRYAGYRYDENTKLYYLIARYYNPVNGVFLSIDPIRGYLTDPLTLNGYNYVSNNPVIFNDPTGTFRKLTKNFVYIGGTTYVVMYSGKKYIMKQVGKLFNKGTSFTININKKPNVSNGKLKNIINDLYKGQGGRNTIGNGTTMDAVRNEIKTGLPTNGKFHTQKLNDYLNALQRRLRAGDLNDYDTAVVNALIDDIKKAQKGQ